MLAKIEEKIKGVEQQVAQALAQHTFLSGALTALKEALTLGEAISPASPVVAGIEEAVNVGDEVISALDELDPASPATDASTEQPAPVAAS
jgi:hypothetical protein